jgi:signal transduction histidine kinase
MSLAKTDHSLLGLSAGVPDTAEAEQDRAVADGNDTVELGQKRSQANSGEPLLRELAMNAMASRFQVEVAPLQSVFIDDARIFIFRRVAIRNQIYRQGFILLVEPFLRHLLDAHYNQQPVAAYTRLNLFVKNRGFGTEGGQGERNSNHGVLVSSRAFPAPFGFLMAEMMAEAVPASAARRSLNMAFGALWGIMIFGLWAIHHSARTVSEMAERRSQFVSSVTHELKTPLTNIRMYIEMLDQGIATTHEREQDYLRVLASESVRLSRLINHVLELSKLEKKQRRFNLQKGRLEDVLAEVRSLMAQKLTQEGFELEIRAQHIPAVTFDYEVMIQVLINLLENSVKFGRHEPEKKILISASPSKGWVHLAVSDTGPGIPRGSLKKVFDDFYRADHDMIRVTAGTGIGLALVKKFITAMGGRVQAANNPVAGCTITLSLPIDAKP